MSEQVETVAYSNANFFVTALRSLIVNPIPTGLPTPNHPTRQAHRHARIPK